MGHPEQNFMFLGPLRPHLYEVFDGSDPKPNGTRHQVRRRRTFKFSRAFKTLYVICALFFQ